MPYKDKEKRAAYTKEYGANWYQKHKEEVIERRKQRQREILDWFRRYKSSLSCMDCGVSHPAILQFHHRDRTEKSFTISNIVSRATSIRQLTNEIKKCDVVCANCHAKRHWRENHATDSWEEVIPSEE